MMASRPMLLVPSVLRNKEYRTAQQPRARVALPYNKTPSFTIAWWLLPKEATTGRPPPSSTYKRRTGPEHRGRLLWAHTQNDGPTDDAQKTNEQEEPEVEAPPPSQDLARTPLYNHVHHNKTLGSLSSLSRLLVTPSTSFDHQWCR